MFIIFTATSRSRAYDPAPGRCVLLLEVEAEKEIQAEGRLSTDTDAHHKKVERYYFCIRQVKALL